MRIGIDIKPLSRQLTGIGNYIKSFLLELSKLDSKNEYYLYTNKPLKADLALNKNFRIINYKARVGTFGVRYKLKKLLKRDKIDVFWGPDHCLPRKTKNIKTIITIHDLALFKFKGISSTFNTLLMKVFLKKFVKEADVVFCDSEATKKDVVSLFKAPKEKLHVVYLGKAEGTSKKLSKSEVDDAIDKFNIRKGFFLFISTIEPRKNIMTLVKAFEKYRQDNPLSEKKLVLIGGRGWKCNHIYEYIERSKFKSQILLLGYVSSLDKDALLERCDCFVFPSLYEGFGLPLLEAMEKEKICITTNISSLPEVGGDAVYYLNDVFDYEALSKMLGDVDALDETRKNNIKEKSIKQSGTFSYCESAKKVLLFFEGLTNE